MINNNNNNNIKIDNRIGNGHGKRLFIRYNKRRKEFCK